MKNHAKKAFNALRKMGIQVREADESKWADRGHFWIDCECGDTATTMALEYYSNYEGSDELNKILDDNGLYFEWYNAAFACVYDN